MHNDSFYKSCFLKIIKPNNAKMTINPRATKAEFCATVASLARTKLKFKPKYLNSSILVREENGREAQDGSPKNKTYKDSYN